MKELPTFFYGMCYVIELKDKYLASDFLALTVKKKEWVKMDFVNWKLTSDYDYLGVSWLVSFMPFKFTLLFGDIMTHKIIAVQTIRNPLKCKMYNSDYVSKQQCMVYDFFDKDFSPCPVKCIPIQMRGFRYINNSSDLKNCNKLDDEICHGGPSVWKELHKRFKQCMTPCTVSSYDDSLHEKKEMYMKDNENEATFEFMNSDVSPVEKEVLLYDLFDVIGTIGGSLGVTVGISIFAIISCCIDKFLELIDAFQARTLLE